MKRIPCATLSYPFPHEFDAKKYSEHYLLSHVPESGVQASILDLLWKFKVDAIPIDAGVEHVRGAVYNRLLRQTKLLPGEIMSILRGGIGSELPPGHSDLAATLAPEGRSLYIEVKAPAWINERGKIVRSAEKPTQEQLDFLLSKFKRGAIVMVAYSIDDVANYLDAQLRRNFEAARSEGL